MTKMLMIIYYNDVVDEYDDGLKYDHDHGHNDHVH